MGSSAKKTTLQRYLSQLQQHPLRTKLECCLVLVMLFRRNSLGYKPIFEFYRLLQQIFADGFLGPVGHFFHTTMDKIFQGKKDTDCCKEGNRGTADIVTIEPFAFHDLLWRTPWNLVRGRIKKTYPTVQLTAWAVSDRKCCVYYQCIVFPIMGWVNYKYVPLHFRVILHSLVAFFW
ncbi:hypothetical protein IGI04_036250 [Brassica rapa subsp. trilocularis]|uniref:Uncharacterized protein n=1 Tax=Brassica rapa subsp. trilocularis TaxID=1813537 RepID=A0ABQ7LDW7_BRACM|nr:hypothetical protein IGI04_036250 [Brassica rapa subsp. trilocularis]